jgi:hypothetical protein
MGASEVFKNQGFKSQLFWGYRLDRQLHQNLLELQCYASIRTMVPFWRGHWRRRTTGTLIHYWQVSFMVTWITVQMRSTALPAERVPSGQSIASKSAGIAVLCFKIRTMVPFWRGHWRQRTIGTLTHYWQVCFKATWITVQISRTESKDWG